MGALIHGLYRGVLAAAPDAAIHAVLVIAHVYRHLWSRRVPLVQEQDHLVIYRLPA